MPALAAVSKASDVVDAVKGALPGGDKEEEELEEGDGNKKTDKHDDHPKLKGGQKNLPDALQKGIIGSSDADESDDDKDKKSDDDKKDESVDHLQEAIASLLRKHLRG